MDISEFDKLAEQIKVLYEKYDAKKLELDRINEELKPLEDKAISLLQESGRTSFKTPFGTLIASEQWSVKIPRTEEAKKELFKWLEEKQLFWQLANVNSQSLNSLFKQCKEESEERGELSFQLPGVEPATLNLKFSFRKGN